MSTEKEVRPTDNNQNQSDSEEEGQDQGCFGGIFKRTSKKRNQVANPRHGSSIFANLLRLFFYVQQNFVPRPRRPRNQLKQLEYASQDSSTDDSFPTDWPRQKDVQEAVRVKMCSLDSPIRKQNWDCKMALLCLVATESKNSDHEKADCFILIILSHGSEHGIYGVDGNTLSLDENIKPFFTADQCPFLAGKPKLFFIQACQGGTYDTGVSVPYEEDSFVNEAEATESSTGAHLHFSDATVCHPARKTRRVPTFADMFVASSCTKGFVSFRHENLGSWFIQAIVYVFQRYAHEKEIGQLLTLVHNLVAKARGLNESTQTECMQAASISSTLTKNFFFFPGIFE